MLQEDAFTRCPRTLDAWMELGSVNRAVSINNGPECRELSTKIASELVVQHANDISL